MKIDEAKNIASKIIDQFPKSKNGQSFLTMKNGRKVFFNRFIKKYGLDGNFSKYSNLDIKRRMVLVEFFEFFMTKNLLPARKEGRFLLESHFHRMVIIEEPVGRGSGIRYELLSFYPK